MSLNYNPDSIVGGPLSSGPLKLLKQRSDILSKKQYTTEEITYLNSTTAWVRLYSSVDVESLDSETGAESYTSELAKQFQLLGGTLYEDTLRKGFITGDGQEKSSYDFSNVFGYVPMPGISSFQVQSRNTFGTLRAATIEFKVNSIEQLTNLEQLYLRPGFTCLIEWGHSNFIDTEGNISSFTNGIGSKFFDYGGKDAVNNLQKDIDTIKNNSNFNYDAMFGFIKNFEWAYAENGEYDCRIDVISKGELVESLSTVVFRRAEERDEKDKSDIIKDATPLHSLLYNIKDSFLYENPRKALHQIFDTVEDKLQKVNRELNIVKILGRQLDNGDNYWTYISMGTLLELINLSFMLKNDNEEITKFYFGNKDGKILTPYVTFSRHYMLDPRIGFIPRKAVADESGIKFGYGFEHISETIPQTNTDDILNIMVCVDYVIKCLSNRLEGSTITQQNVFSFVKDIIAGLQDTGGQVNEFDIHYDDDSRMHFIIDRKITPDRNALESSKIDTIGLGSNVVDLSLKSNLTNAVSSMVAISAQVGGTDAGEDLMNLQRWNTGLRDRFYPNKSYTPNFKEEDNENIDYRKLLTIMNSIYAPIATANSSAQHRLNLESPDISGATPLHRRLMQIFLQGEVEKNKTNPSGIIPLELTLTLKGIGGFKIGQAFTIPLEILPERYKEKVNDIEKSKVGFIITGLDHRVEDNMWFTELRSQMIVISNIPTGKPIELPETITPEDASETIYDAVSKPDDELTLKSPVGHMSVRNDKQGGGHYMSWRDNKTRRHKGLDLLAEPGDNVFACFDGVVSIIPEWSRKLPGIFILGTGDYDGYTASLGYCKLNAGLAGKTVSKGDNIGKVVRLGGKSSFDGRGYNSYWLQNDKKMLNHVDIKLRYFKNSLDPEIELNA